MPEQERCSDAMTTSKQAAVWSSSQKLDQELEEALAACQTGASRAEEISRPSGRDNLRNVFRPALIRSGRQRPFAANGAKVCA